MANSASATVSRCPQAPSMRAGSRLQIDFVRAGVTKPPLPPARSLHHGPYRRTRKCGRALCQPMGSGDEDPKPKKEDLIATASKFLLPQREGDFKDYLWMGISIGALVYLSASLYLVYEHLYFSAGFRTFADVMYSKR